MCNCSFAGCSTSKLALVPGSGGCNALSNNNAINICYFECSPLYDSSFLWSRTCATVYKPLYIRCFLRNCQLCHGFFACYMNCIHVLEFFKVHLFLCFSSSAPCSWAPNSIHVFKGFGILSMTPSGHSADRCQFLIYISYCAGRHPHGKGKIILAFVPLCAIVSYGAR